MSKFSTFILKTLVYTVILIDLWTIVTYIRLKNETDSSLDDYYEDTINIVARNSKISNPDEFSDTLLYFKKESQFDDKSLKNPDDDNYSDERNVFAIPETDENNGSWIVPPAERVTLDPTIVLYNRVPKCGSTTMLTLIKALKKFHKMKNINPFYTINDIKPNQKHFLPTLQERLEFTRNLTEIPRPMIYIRHLHFLNFTHYNSPMPLYINIIRDPVEHFISNYYYLRHGFQRNQEKLNEYQKARWSHSNVITNQDERDQNLTVCINTELPSCKNVYSDIIPYFCGNDPWCRKRDRRALDQAKHNLLHSFIAVGVLEQFEESLELFEMILPQFFKGIRWLYQRHTEELQEKSKTANKVEESDAVKSFLRARLGPEIELYEFAQQTMRFRLESLRKDVENKNHGEI